VALVRADVSEELSASFIRTTRIGELGTTLAVTSNRRTLFKRNYAGNRQRSFKIMIMRMFATLDKAKPDTENIRGFNLAAVKCMTVEVSRVPWWP
jgi:hypothetical protein